MIRIWTVLAAAVLLLLASSATNPSVAQDRDAPAWSFNATIIEACSCTMFCQCYFNTEPQGHHGHGGMEHFCRFNNAFRVNRGIYGDVRLDGVLFWVAGDLGAEFSDGKMKWATLTFHPATTEGQRQAVQTILGRLYPVEWESFTVEADQEIAWRLDRDEARAALGGGKAAEVVLARFPGMTEEPVVIQNLRYWGAPRNEGFILMPHQVEAYRLGPSAFEFTGGNGFVITVDIASTDTAHQ